MTEIFINGERKTYLDWEIFKNRIGVYTVKLIFKSGKKYYKSLDECDIVPDVIRNEDILYEKRKKVYSKITYVRELGDKYCIIKYQGSEKDYLFECCNIEILSSNNIFKGDILEYFKNVAKERLSMKNNLINQSVVNQFDKLLPIEKTSLYAYISKKSIQYDHQKNLIFPFGVNETQLEAIKAAFSSQVSVIEGPPGTGKTQTILNIIANILIDGKTCGIASNNNPAVLNIYEKMQKENADYFIAKLGNTENKVDFLRI